MEKAKENKFPLKAEDYNLYEEIGEGVSATVYKALCIPRNELVAIKVLDLEKCNNDLDGIRKEVQMMILIDHPNVMRAHCSFISDHYLWIVMPFMAAGSCLHIMKWAYPEGFEENVIATILHEVLKGLVYLHGQGLIHRDVKAGNILIDSNGTVKLADFGVAACLFDKGDRSRNAFVGTPCWMAPEVMQQLHGYDFKADIWSLGITALELAHGNAPFSKYPPMKVLLMTLQNAPPGLDYERDKRFSKNFKEFVAACLVKDPKKRPSSEKLLKNSFFKHARPVDYLARTIVDGLIPLGERFRMLKEKEADILLQNKELYENKEHLSQQEYIKGISAWNFNMEDLKNQAAVVCQIQDDSISNSDDSNVVTKHIDGQDDKPDIYQTNHCKNASQVENGMTDIDDFENSLASFPAKPLQALKGCFDVCEDDNDGSPNLTISTHSDSEHKIQQQSSTIAVDQEARIVNNGDSGQSVSSLSYSAFEGPTKFPSGSLLQGNILSPRKLIGDGDREHLQPSLQSERNYSGPMQYHQRKDLNNTTAGDNPSEGAVVERRGRFKVTSGDLSPKGPTYSNSVNGGPANQAISGLSAASFLPSLQFMLQQNIMQREELINVIKFLEHTSGNATATEGNESGMNNLSQINATMRERELQAQVIQMQQSIGSIVEELQRLKAKNLQLERKLLWKDDKIPE